VCLLGSLSCRHPDHQTLRLAKDSSQRDYPKADGVTTFDIATSLYKSGVLQQVCSRTLWMYWTGLLGSRRAPAGSAAAVIHVVLICWDLTGNVFLPSTV